MIEHNDKDGWIRIGTKLEDEFIDTFGDKLGIYKNPAREESPYAPDLVVIADLKTCNTPFFTAKKYGFDPEYTVGLTDTAYRNYINNYPTIIVYFDVNWKTLQWHKLTVNPHVGVYRATIGYLHKLITTNRAPLHIFQNRKHDTNYNAKAVYLFDIRAMEKIY